MEGQRLRVFERRFVRRIFGPQNGGSKRRVEKIV
jgi:hypothetical protein